MSQVLGRLQKMSLNVQNQAFLQYRKGLELGFKKVCLENSICVFYLTKNCTLNRSESLVVSGVCTYLADFIRTQHLCIVQVCEVPLVFGV